MATLINASGLTLQADEAKDVSEAVFERSFENERIETMHTIQTGVERDRFIPFFGRLGLTGKAQEGCTPTVNAGSIPTSQKKWTPKTIGDRLAHCEKDLSPLFKVWQRKKKSLDQWNAIDMPHFSFIEDRVSESIEESILRHIAFGDTSADTVANSGSLTNGTDKTFFNVIDGYWKQIETMVAGNSALKVAITENAGVTKTAQANLADDAAYKTMKAMYEGADARLLEADGVYIALTKSMWDNWVAYMEDKSVNFTLDEVKDGITKKTFRGIPIIVDYFWDRMIRSYFDNGTIFDRPNRALMTVRDNMPIGTLDEGSLSELDSFYDKKDKTNYIDFAYDLDVKVLEDYMLMVAY